MLGVLQRWAQHRTTDDADDNATYWGSWAIYYLVTGDPDSKARLLSAGAEGVLRAIASEDTSAASTKAKQIARIVLKENLGLLA